MARWLIKKNDANIGLMSQTLRISPVLANVLANRGIRSKNEAIKHLNPAMKFLNAEDMAGMREGVELVADAIKTGARIAIYGDYDADGVSATVILHKTLECLGADVFYYIPRREEDGYGLTMAAVERLKEAETDLIFCCDNGVSALDEILLARKLGMAVVVLDHHEPVVIEKDGQCEELLPLAAVIDPKRKDCPYPYKELCAGGLAYKFAERLYDQLGRDFTEHSDEYLIFAMIATFCDIVDLTGENRIFAKNGLKILNTNKQLNLGLWRLIVQRGYEHKDLNEQSIGFVIGPCINASGRLSHAGLAVELFLTDDEAEADEKAAALAQLNEERKEITATACERVLENLVEDDNVLVIYDPTVHESVAGIVAGRVRERVYKPVMVLSKSGGLVKGSGRSVEGYDMHGELDKCRELLVKFGGHTMAAGFSIEEGNIDVLRQRLNENCSDRFEEILHIDLGFGLESVTYELANELQMLAPYGKANKEPLFGVKAAVPEQLRVIPDKDTMIFTFLIGDSYRPLKGICFGKVALFRERLAERYDEQMVEKICAGVLRGSNLKMDLAYAIDIDGYNDNKSVQVRIRDFRIV